MENMCERGCPVLALKGFLAENVVKLIDRFKIYL